MLLTRFVLLAVGFVLVAGGCATGGAPGEASGSRTGRTSDGALLTLHDQDHGPVWGEWEPAEGRPVRPAELGGRVQAFDYWQVDDAEVVEEVWAALFPVLDAVRGDVDRRGRRNGFDLILEALEPAGGERGTRMDLTFLVSRSEEAKFEGFACRLYRRLDAGATPAVTVLFLRRPDAATTPGRIVVWTAPRFREAESVTAIFERVESQWSRRLMEGLRFPDFDADEGASGGESGRLAARVLTRAIWKRFAGRAYLESSQSGRRSEEPNPEGVAEALGLEVVDRRIAQVYSNTEFPPRADLDEL